MRYWISEDAKPPPTYVITRSYKQCDPAGLWAVADTGDGPQGSGPSPYFQTKMFFGAWGGGGGGGVRAHPFF